jgi:hypothetical protein
LNQGGHLVRLDGRETDDPDARSAEFPGQFFFRQMLHRYLIGSFYFLELSR